MAAKKLIPWKKVLAEIDVSDRPFSIEFIRTTGGGKGNVVTKTKVKKTKGKKAPSIASLFPQRRISTRAKPRGAYKGNNIRDRTLPLYDCNERRFFKVKINSIIRFKGMRVVYEEYREGSWVHPKVKNGRTI